MKVPFVDLKMEYLSLETELKAAIDDVFQKTSFILGPQVSQFEKEFAEFLEVQHSVGVASGTDALKLAFAAIGIGPGDEVLIPANTFIATALGITSCGARPQLVDVNPDTFLMDDTKIETAVTHNTKAICPVHLYGRACNMENIVAIAKKHNLQIIEDAAQAHGARWNGKRIGTFGDIGCFSFYPGKNLGAIGDGGAIVTASTEYAFKVRKLRNYGSIIKYEHPELGTNSRLDSVQAAILSVKLKQLETWNRKRWDAAKHYHEVLHPLQKKGLILPEVPEQQSHVFHLFVLQHENRDTLIKKLSEAEIQTVIHYPTPVHMHGGFDYLGYKKGEFPVAEAQAKKIFSLPMFPEISQEQIQFVADQLAAAL